MKLKLYNLILVIQIFTFSNAYATSNTNISESLMVPIDGILEEEDVGKSLTDNLQVGDDLVQFRTAPRRNRTNTKISAATCHFYANQVKDNGQFVSGLDQNISVALHSAYEENCQTAVIHVYHAVIDGYTKGNFRGAGIRDDLLSDIGDIDVSPNNISDVLAFRRSLGNHYVKTVYNGFLAVMKIEFSFKSREDINNMSAIFAENISDMLPTNQAESSETAGDNEAQVHNRESVSQRTSSISRQMARKKINGSWKIKTYIKGSLENEARFPFIQTDMSAFAGNYGTLLDQMGRFNNWVLNINSTNIIDSQPILVDIGAIKDSRNLFHKAIVGLTVDGESISLSRLEIETSKMFRAIVAAKTAFCGVVNSPTRKNKEKRLLKMLQGSHSHIEYLVQNSIPIDERTGSTILHWAAVYDLPELVEMMVQMDTMGTLVDARDYLGRTPLMRAAANGSLRVAQILVDNSASINYVDANGKSALTYATMTSSTGSKQLACAGVGIAVGVICPPVALVGLAGEAYVMGERIISPDRLCEHVFSCGHSKIARLLTERGADPSLESSNRAMNTFSNALTGPWRTVHKGIRYAGKFGQIDDDRN